MISTPRQGHKKGLQLEAILVEAMLVLPQAITTGHILPPECRQSEKPFYRSFNILNSTLPNFPVRARFMGLRRLQSRMKQLHDGF